MLGEEKFPYATRCKKYWILAFKIPSPKCILMGGTLIRLGAVHICYFGILQPQFSLTVLRNWVFLWTKRSKISPWAKFKLAAHKHMSTAHVFVIPVHPDLLCTYDKNYLWLGQLHWKNLQCRNLCANPFFPSSCKNWLKMHHIPLLYMHYWHSVNLIDCFPLKSYFSNSF